MCCHPSLAPESRLTLILKTLCGLSVAAIACALLTTESTINKRSIAREARCEASSSRAERVANQIAKQGR